MFPRFFVIVPLIKAFGGQVVASAGFTPSFLMASGIAADFAAVVLSAAAFTGSLTLVGVVGTVAGEGGGDATSGGF